MLAFGIIGFSLRQLNFPMAPLVLGIVLGDLLEKNLRRGLAFYDGDLTPFFLRPISFVMFFLVAVTVLMNIPAFTNAMSASGRHNRGLGRQSRMNSCEYRCATKWSPNWISPAMRSSRGNRL